ncbi:hypothetical protein B0H13DRAFT_1883842 [Mycena leptocephala]|nr:hypothetical protein B0H13DRAFT_1883842 [Mycena leptocephala]
MPSSHHCPANNDSETARRRNSRERKDKYKVQYAIHSTQTRSPSQSPDFSPPLIPLAIFLLPLPSPIPRRPAQRIHTREFGARVQRLGIGRAWVRGGAVLLSITAWGRRGWKSWGWGTVGGAHEMTEFRRCVIHVHDLNHACTAATTLGRGHQDAEDDAGEGIRHVPAVRDGERLGRVLRVGVAIVAVVRVVGMRVRVRMVLRGQGRGRVRVAAPVTMEKVVRGAVVLLRAAGWGACMGAGESGGPGRDGQGGDSGAVKGGGGRRGRAGVGGEGGDGGGDGRHSVACYSGLGAA